MMPKDNVPRFRTEDMNLMNETPYMSVETAIRLLAWHVEQLVKDPEARAELVQIRKDMELLTKAKARSTPDFLDSALNEGDGIYKP